MQFTVFGLVIYHRNPEGDSQTAVTNVHTTAGTIEHVSIVDIFANVASGI